MNRPIRTSLSLIALCFAAHAAVAAPTLDVVTAGTATGTPGASVDVAVYIRDSAGTPLGVDQPAGSRIQAYSITVIYAPAADVQSVTFTRAGITAPLTPTFESSPSSSGSISLIDTFSETTNLIPFSSNAPLPGNQIGVLHFALASNAAPGAVTLTLDPTLTQLSDQAGTITQTTGAGNLLLVNGSITINAATPVRLQSFEVK